MLSIPLNGFPDKWLMMARTGDGAQLSIPLNGFLEMISEVRKFEAESFNSIERILRSVWGESSHAMTLDLSIPLNGFF